MTIDRRALLAGLIPLSYSGLLPGAIIKTTTLGDRPSGWRQQFERDQKADPCPICNIRHVRSGTTGGRLCHNADLIARVEQLYDEIDKASDKIQELGKTDDDLHTRINDLRAATKVYRMKGNATYSRDLHGFANGMTLALHIMEHENSGGTDAPFLKFGEGDE
jgi:hypothetical protein